MMIVWQINAALGIQSQPGDGRSRDEDNDASLARLVVTKEVGKRRMSVGRARDNGVPEAAKLKLTAASADL